MGRRRFLDWSHYLLLAIILVSLLTVLIPVSVVKADSVVTFPDANLEAAIREAIGKPTGDIYQSDLDGLAVLTANDQGIVSLDGLEHCTSLTSLNLGPNQISDISPLSSLSSLTHLWLAYNQISDISPLAGLTSLTRLYLPYNQISDISPLSGLTGLTLLELDHNQISDLSPLAGLTNLDLLSAGSHVSDISPLAGLTNLTMLWLYDNQISDLSPISGLTNLESLSVGSYISDISPLAGLTSLTQLDLRSNQIGDITPLSGLTSLTWLVLYENQISDISPLAGLTSLTTLWLSWNQIGDISPLAGLTSLTTLGLNRSQIGDVSPLAGLTSLTGLDLGSNHVSDISPLAGLTKLTWLNLGWNQIISDISPLAGLTKLTDLTLASNQMSDISPLAGLTKLTRLNLDWNQTISDISPVGGLTNLTNLGLSVSQISDISPVAGLTNLTDLYLGFNQISDISPLAGLTSLTSLYLHQNQIGDISPLAGLTSLTTLWLHYNQISDLSALAGLASLTTLWLHSNQISDISPLVNNPGMASGDTVYLNSNPLNSTSINTYIPTLQARGVTVYWDAPANQPPNQPTNLFPLDQSTDVTLTPMLEASAFSDPDLGDTLAVSQWEIATTSGDYSAPLFGFSSVTGLPELTVPSGTLDPDMTYYWHVRYQDNHGAWSGYSDETSFSTTQPSSGELEVHAYGLEREWSRDASDQPICQVDVAFSITNTGDVDATDIHAQGSSEGITFPLLQEPIAVLHPGDVYKGHFHRDVTYDTVENVALMAWTADASASFNLSLDAILPRSYCSGDAMYLVTPNDGTVKATLNDILADCPATQPHWMAIRDWVAGNIHYVGDMQNHGVVDYWQLPKETIESRSGDCEDFAILLVSLLRADGWGPDDVSVVIGENSQHVYHGWVRVWTGIGWYTLEPQLPSIYTLVGDYDHLHDFNGILWFNDSHYYGPAWESISTATATGLASFTPDSGEIQNLVAVPENALPTGGKPNMAFPNGFFAFQIQYLTPGTSVTIDIKLPSAVPTGTEYWKYGPTPDNATSHWYQVPVVRISGDVITIRLTDNGLGDDILAGPDGVIIDQGGPGWRGPNLPSNISPADEAVGIAITPTLVSSAFSDLDAVDTHAASQWQITTMAGDYSSPVFDSGNDPSNLTSITVPSGILSNSTTYYWSVRHQDNHGNWSAWSVETSLVTVSAYPKWDINQDGKVDYKDLAILGAHYGETMSPPYPAWDINQDGKVDYKDLAILGAHYGEVY